MIWELVTFYTLAFLLVGSSLAVILMRSPVHSAMALVFALFIMAILFLALSAPMVAVLQVLVYAGAIMVLFLFVIMLLNPGVVEGRSFLTWGFASAAAALLVLILMAIALSERPETALVGVAPLETDFGSPHSLGRTLFYHYVLPFEIVSVLLLVAIVGAIVLAKRES